MTANGKEVRVGVVGAGYVSTHHLRALCDLPFIRIVGVCDADPQRARQLAGRFAIPGVYASLGEMAQARPQVIHVLTPPDSHCALTLEALDMGCHVFVEKPMAGATVECDRMIASARDKGLVVSVNHSARLDPVVLEALGRVRRGDCGDLIALHFFRGSQYPPFAGGRLPAMYGQGSYPFRDLGVHGLCLAESFLGPIHNLDVRHYGSGRDPLLIFDEWRAHLECEKGTAELFLSWNMRPMQNELWIHGTGGILHVDCFLQICQFYKARSGPKPVQFVRNAIGTGARKVWQAPRSVLRFATGALKPSPGIYFSVQQFHKALAAGTAVPVPAEEGRRMVAFIEQASYSADRRREALLREELEKPLPPARVLVTGSAGFLGGALLDRLRGRGESLRLLLRKPVPALNGLPAVYGSLGQPEVVDKAVEGVQVVYHVGAAMKGSPLEFEQGTIWGTRNIIDACLRHRVSRLVYVSSLSVLDHVGHAEEVPVTEDSPLEPHPDRRGGYTQSKLRAEQMVLDAARDRGLPAVVLRPGQIFGPGSEHVAPNGVIAIAGQWLLAGRGVRKLPLVFVDDVVDGLLAAETAETAAGQLIHLVDVEPVSQNEFLAAGRNGVWRPPVRKVPVWVLLLGGWMCELLGAVVKRSLPLSRYKVKALRPLAPMNNDRARQLLGWTPRVGVREGLRRTFPDNASSRKP